MKRLAVINVVGLIPSLIGENTPFLRSWLQSAQIAQVQPPLPAVTCSVQATFLTGVTPGEHGIVGNGWYFKDECEVRFWRQSNNLVTAPKIWDFARHLDPSFTVANLFWWYNMYSTADISVTPRPMYPADGRKLPDIYTHPGDLRDRLQNQLGQFPLFHFWGPMASIKSSHWIAEATKIVVTSHTPTLTLVYIPHLDYCLQKYGPETPESHRSLKDVDRVLEDLIDFLQTHDIDPVILSEYGITPVKRSISINRTLRKAGLLSVRNELGRELLDAGASRAFAVADHQVAHVYINGATDRKHIESILRGVEGIDLILDGPMQEGYGIRHDRSGDFVVIAKEGWWFDYYYWLDDDKAPDFARTVDIHRKPGYDPVELFLDPEDLFLKPKMALKLLGKKIGMRTLLDFIPLQTHLVRGSHGRLPSTRDQAPLFATLNQDVNLSPIIQATDVKNLILDHIFPK